MTRCRQRSLCSWRGLWPEACSVKMADAAGVPARSRTPLRASSRPGCRSRRRSGRRRRRPRSRGSAGCARPRRGVEVAGQLRATALASKAGATGAGGTRSASPSRGWKRGLGQGDQGLALVGQDLGEEAARLERARAGCRCLPCRRGASRREVQKQDSSALVQDRATTVVFARRALKNLSL